MEIKSKILCISNFKKGAGLLIFLFFLFMVLNKSLTILRPKFADSGIADLWAFYELPKDSVDILILGSSHSNANINTGMLWDEYGFAAFNLWGSNQYLWHSYYYLEEALKTQKPKLIILESTSLRASEDYSDEWRMMANISGLKISLTKLKSIQAGIPKEKQKSYIIAPLFYHKRYNNLRIEDFVSAKKFDFNKGSYFFMSSNWQNFSRRLWENKTAEIPEKSAEYYQKIIWLAQKNNIPLLSIISPYTAVYPKEMRIFNEAERISAQQGVPFINGFKISWELGLKDAEDFHDGDHLSYKGSRKWTAWLGRYIVAHYAIPNRKKDKKYASWEQNAFYFRNLIYNKKLKETYNLQEYMSELENKEYVVNHIVLRTSDVNIFGKEGAAVIKNGEYIPLQNGAIIELDKWKTARLNDLSIKINGKEYQTVQNGINIVVYDVLTERVVDAVGFDASNLTSAIRK